MKAIQRATGKQSEAVPSTLTPLYDALIQGRQRAVRLSDDHYLVQWKSNSSTWCVIDMCALDKHAANCRALRYRLHCEHIELIYQLCSEENRMPVRMLH